MAFYWFLLLTRSDYDEVSSEASRSEGCGSCETRPEEEEVGFCIVGLSFLRKYGLMHVGESVDGSDEASHGALLRGS